MVGTEVGAVNGAVAATAEKPRCVVKIRIDPDQSRTFMNVAAISHEAEWLFNVEMKKDKAGKYYRVRLPKGERIQTPDAYKYGVVERDPDQSVVERDPDRFQESNDDVYDLTESEWATTKIVLNGVADPTHASADVRRRESSADVSWLWDRRIPSGGVTLLAGPPKAGKSTILRGLLHAGDEETRIVPFLGAGVRPVRAIVVTEETRIAWHDAPSNCRLLYVEGDPPKKIADWEKFVRQLRQLAIGHKSDLICLDSFAAVCGADENNAKQVTKAFGPLRQLASWDMTVLVLHHTTKYAVGSAAVRGSSAISASCDAVLTLACVGEDESDPRRVLASVSRLARPARVEYAMRPDGALGLPSEAKGGRRNRSLIGSKE